MGIKKQIDKKPAQVSTTDYEAINQKLLAAIVTLTTTFILVAIGLYWLLGRS